MAHYEPPPRGGHAAVRVGSKLHLWGGDAGVGKDSRELAGVVELFDILTEMWEKKATVGTPPPGLWGAAHTAIGTFLYSFGGSDGTTYWNNLHRLNTRTWEWKEVVARNPSSAPMKKTGSGMVALDEELLVFAGCTEGPGYTNELYLFNTLECTWSCPATTGDRPPPCGYFTFTKLDATRVAMFGGWTEHEQLNDVYILDVGQWHWTKLEVSGPKPPARSEHTACCIAGPLTGQEHPLLLVVGGEGGLPFTALQDAWILDIDKRRWKQVALSGDVQLQSGHSATVFGAGQSFRQLVMVGGKYHTSSETTGTILINFELRSRVWYKRDGEWVVTGVLRGDQLGRPEERLREKVERLEPTSSKSDVEKLMESQEALRKANYNAQEWKERVRDATTRLIEFERRAITAEEMSGEAERRATEAMEWVREAELRAGREAYRRVQQFEESTISETTQAKERVKMAEREIATLHARVEEAEIKAQLEGENATQAQQRFNEAEKRAEMEEREIIALRTRMEEAGIKAQLEEEKAAQAQQRADEAEARAQRMEWELVAMLRRTEGAEERAHNLEQRVDQVGREAQLLQEAAAEATVRARIAEDRETQAMERVEQAEEGLRLAEHRAIQADGIFSQQFWVVQRGDIELTDQELGRGGWAVVRVAKFRGLRVAAKCLHNLIISDYNRRLFAREMNIAARVRHPNLIQFIGATLEGEAIILTELMATSLRALLERRPLNPTQTTSIALDIARALNYLHLMRPDAIIHRDISSANVLLDPGPNNSWRAKVSDYGSANFLQQLRTAGPGNPTYAAPEAGNPSQQSPKMDVYSYGVLLLEMCTRTFPSSEDRDALLQNVRQPAMATLIRQCWQQEPERRPSMSEIVERLNLMSHSYRYTRL